MATNKKPGGANGREPGHIENINLGDLTGNSADSQRRRLLKHLHTEGIRTTQEARQFLDTMAPAPRVFGLRAQGISIVTAWITVATAYDKTRRIARYVLLSEGDAS